MKVSDTALVKLLLPPFSRCQAWKLNVVPEVPTTSPMFDRMAVGSMGRENEPLAPVNWVSIAWL